MSSKDPAPPYPHSDRTDVADELHGRTIADPYRWMEDPDSDATREWVVRQNAFTEERLRQLPGRDWFQSVMARILRRPRAGVPVKRGGKYVVTRNDGSLDQDQIFVADSLQELRAGGRLLLDPNTLSEDGTTSIRSHSASDDGRYLSYQVSEGGSDWVDFTLMDLATGDPVDDAPIQTKIGSATWLPDDASFVYPAVPHTGRADGSQAAQVQTGLLKLHRVGDSADDDQVVVDVRDEYIQGMVQPVVSADRRFLIVHIGEGTEHVNRLWVYRITDVAGRSRLSEPLKLIDEPLAQFDFVRSHGDSLILFTDYRADRGRVVRLDLAGFDDSDELPVTDVIPQAEDAILAVVAPGDELVAIRLTDAQPRVFRHALDGSQLGEINVAGGAVTGVWADPRSTEWFIGMSTVTAPIRAYRVSTGSSDADPLDDLVPTGSGFTAPDVTVTRHRATSRDGTAVPYFLITPQDGSVPPRGTQPTLLYGYGGFNIPVEADYRPMWPGWLAAGGVIAIANLRGGGEYGATWYDDGRLDNKQHVFDDFIAVGDHLVETGVTTHDQLAIHGRSNGGLLVGATMTQRPDLAAVALPAVGVLDLLRFHKFTIGAAWTSDFGNPDDESDFPTVLAYSPLHNITQTAYPATLIMTGDHDDRVVPLHSHKFTATLQRAQHGTAPVLTRIETRAGHGMGKPTSMVAAEMADMLAFAAHFTGLRVPT